MDQAGIAREVGAAPPRPAAPVLGAEPDHASAAPRTAAAEPVRRRQRQLRMLRPHLDALPPLAVPSGYRLRTYRPGDELAWAAIMSAPDGIGRDWTAEKVRERLIDQPVFEPEGLFFATCDAEGGRPVASACAWRGSLQEHITGTLHMVCALVEHRGHGLGRLVSLAVLHYLRERGFSACDLLTDDWRLAAIRTYLGLGFIPVYLPLPEEVASPYYGDDHQVRWSAVFARLLGAPPG
jgi:mycothiol synthase